jgi:hypothetical protein
MSLKDTLPPSRAELHALGLLRDIERDQLITLPASIVADLLQDIATWRDIATRQDQLH